MSGILDRLTTLYREIDRVSGGRLKILVQSVERFNEMRGAEAAATLAYYALFSLFPLLLFLIVLTSFLLQSNEQAYRTTVTFIQNALPVSAESIENSIREVLELRGEFGAIGLIAMLWAASAFFSTLARNINRAWPSAKLRSPLQIRLIGIGMVGALFILLLLSMLSTTIVGLLPALIRVLGGDGTIFESALWQWALRGVPAAFSFLMFMGLYQWVPNRRVRWRAVLWGALFVALAWETAKQAFGYLLSSGLINYEFIYGSLGTLVMLMFWAYVSNLMALFGAYLVATLDMRIEVAETEPASGGPAQSDPVSSSGAGKPVNHRPVAR
jgi:membrane protein